jgi:hypothetical protein
MDGAPTVDKQKKPLESESSGDSLASINDGMMPQVVHTVVMEAGFIHGIDAQGKRRMIPSQHGALLETTVIDPKPRICPPAENRKFWSQTDYDKHISQQIGWFENGETVAYAQDSINEFRASEASFYQDYFAAAQKPPPKKNTTSFNFALSFERSAAGCQKMLAWFDELEKDTENLPLVLVNVLGDHQNTNAKKWFHLPLADQRKEFITFCKKVMFAKTNAVVVLQIHPLDVKVKTTTVLNMTQSFESQGLTESSNVADDSD